jgi:hypothetical protein
MLTAEHAGHLNEHDGQGHERKYQAECLDPSRGLVLIRWIRPDERFRASVSWAQWPRIVACPADCGDRIVKR